MVYKVKETDYILAWFVSMLCTLVVVMIVGFCTGGVIGFTLALLKAPMEIIRIVAQVAGFLISLPISYAFFRTFVKMFIVKKFEAAAEVPDEQPN